MFQAILKFLAGGAAEQVGEYLRERQKLKQELKLTKLKSEIDLVTAKTQAKIEQQKHIASWEQAYVNMQTTSYKDEVVLAVVLFPYVGAFVPGVQDYILIGFQYLEKMPYWAVGLTVAICLAIYGIRHRNASKINAPGLRREDVRDDQANANG
jgi:hypothetical protein